MQKEAGSPAPVPMRFGEGGREHEDARRRISQRYGSNELGPHRVHVQASSTEKSGAGAEATRMLIAAATTAAD